MRLNKGLRWNIAKSISGAVLADVFRELDDREHTLARSLLEHFLTASGVSEAMIRAVPDDWLPRVSFIMVNCCIVRFASDTHVPNWIAEGNLRLAKRHHLALDLSRLESSRVALVKRHKDLIWEVSSVLAKFSTVGSLLRAWPEVAPYVTTNEEVGSGRRDLFRVVPEQLRKMIHVKMDEEKVP